MQERSGRVGKKVGCGLCGCLLTIPAFIFAIFYFTIFSNTCAKMMGEETYPIKGDPTKFDPIAALPEIREKVGKNAILLDMDASSVRPDGTLDLKAAYKPAPTATYTFQLPLDKAPDGQTAPPVGAGRGPNDQWAQRVTVRVYEPGQRRHVTRISGNSRSSYSYTNEGMDIDRATARMEKIETGITDIKITPKQMWDIAIKLGADPNSVGTISIDERDFEFNILGTDIDLRWDKSGKIEENLLDEDQKEKLGLPTRS